MCMCPPCSCGAKNKSESRFRALLDHYLFPTLCIYFNISKHNIYSLISPNDFCSIGIMSSSLVIAHWKVGGKENLFKHSYSSQKQYKLGHKFEKAPIIVI